MKKALLKLTPEKLRYPLRQAYYKISLRRIKSKTIPRDKADKTKKVVYTCITGGYDNLLVHKCRDLNWDYVCFTDNKKLLDKKFVNGWEIRPLEFEKMDNQRNSRWHKIFPNELFPDHDYSLWIDPSINILDEFVFKRSKEFILKNKIFIQSVHPEGSCIYKEAERVIELGLDKGEIVRKQMQILKKNKYPKDNGLTENGLMLRKHHDKLCVKIMKEWWAFLVNYSRRDQLSLGYVKWKNNFKSESFMKNGKSVISSHHFMMMRGKRKNRRIS